MASGVMRGAVSSALEKDALRLERPRIKTFVKCGTELLEKIVCSENEMTAFDNFSSNVITIFRDMIDSVSKPSYSLATKRGKLSQCGLVST